MDGVGELMTLERDNVGLGAEWTVEIWWQLDDRRGMGIVVT